MVEDGDQQKKDVAESQQISSESEAKKAVYPSTKGKVRHTFETRGFDCDHGLTNMCLANIYPN